MLIQLVRRTMQNFVTHVFEANTGQFHWNALAMSMRKRNVLTIGDGNIWINGT